MIDKLYLTTEDYTKGVDIRHSGSSPQGKHKHVLNAANDKGKQQVQSTLELSISVIKLNIQCIPSCPTHVFVLIGME